MRIALSFPLISKQLPEKLTSAPVYHANVDSLHGGSRGVLDSGRMMYVN